MIKKEVGIGFLVGLIANALGIFLTIQLFGNGEDIQTAIKQVIANGFFGKLLSIGAILNLIVFFVFLKKKQDYRARGVLLATILVAIVSFIFI